MTKWRRAIPSAASGIGFTDSCIATWPKGGVIVATGNERAQYKSDCIPLYSATCAGVTTIDISLNMLRILTMSVCAKRHGKRNIAARTGRDVRIECSHKLVYGE